MASHAAAERRSPGQQRPASGTDVASTVDPSAATASAGGRASARQRASGPLFFDEPPRPDALLVRPDDTYWIPRVPPNLAEARRLGRAPLPHPPTREEKYSYRARHMPVVVVGSAVASAGLVYSQTWFALSTPTMWPFVGFAVLTAVYYLVFLATNAFTPAFNLRRHRRLVERFRPARWASVDVFLPVCGEPARVLRNTWTYVSMLARTYPGSVTVYVLDDGADPELRRMAAEFGFVYSTRPNRGWYKKAGNLHHGFGISGGEIVLILDADFTPRADLLNETVPYFSADPRLGILQTPQYFRTTAEQTWVERGAGAVQEFFYRLVQVGRYRHGGAICVGTCALYRRSALEQNGGTTLIEHSEDVHTGFDLRALGWNLRYIPIVLAAGLCPDNTAAFFAQQYRWCAGSMSLLRSAKFWRARLGYARLCFTSGFLYYLHTALFTIVGPAVPLALLFVVPGHVRLANYVWVAPALIYGLVVIPVWHGCSYRLLDTWAVRMVYGWAHLFAIWDIARGRPMGWRPTGAAAARQGSGARRLMVAVGAWGGTTAAAWVLGACWRITTMSAVNFSPVLLFGLIQAATVVRILVPPRQTGASA